MRPLLWKEMRDLRLWLAGGALLAGAMELLFQSRIRDSWTGPYFELLLPLLLTVAAVGLAAGQIARERHSRSLDYLLVRPVSPGLIVATKFLAGTISLALLVAAIVGLGYVHPELWSDTISQAIRQQIGYRTMLLALFPRYWCVYSLTLLLSVLLDRSAKVAALMVVMAITLPALAAYFENIAPFSRFIYWLPFLDSSMGLVLAAKSAAILSFTGVVFSGATLLVAVAAAALLQRSPERYMGNAGFAAAAIGIVGAAILSAHGAARRLPPVAPVGSFEVDETAYDLMASGSLVALQQDHGIRFLDFTQASQPHEIAFIPLPLSSERASMRGDTVFLLGHKKDIPVDQCVAAIVRPAGPVEEIALGPVRPDESLSAAIPVGSYLYVAITGAEKSSVRIFELASRREVDSLPLERGIVTLSLRASHLYAASMSALAAIDVSNPAHPVVTSRLPVPLRFLLGVPMRIAWQGERLFLLQLFPSSLEAFSLHDPSRPRWQTSLEFHEGMTITASAGGLFRPWLDGVLQFRAEGGDLQAMRYLSGGRRVESVVADGDRVFALTASDDRRMRAVEAFR